MAQPIPPQHPAVVLRSHYTHLRALLAIAMACVVSLTIAVVILAANDGTGAGAPSAADGRSGPTRAALKQPSLSDVHGSGTAPDLDAPPTPRAQRYDGGPEEGTRGDIATRSINTRFDGGPEEGTRGAVATRPTATRFDGGPEEGTRGR